MEASKIRLLCEIAENLSPLLTEIEFLEICKIYNNALDSVYCKYMYNGGVDSTCLSCKMYDSANPNSMWESEDGLR